ncbi:hypothetical protein M1M11_25300 [Pseudomonas azerbaijanoccidens]|uniref:hypothetical protein n=1 Tax=Pseudomonas azerbaijanoccidentalis TaxID=2842347 RepID=UPI000FA38E16|nr:hypothetical protein [Pseudomonas azerbaijanoccidentalis]MCK8668202.1 hypothetical protein [Pseudomonas azerbaijanoccidentalis]
MISPYKAVLLVNAMLENYPEYVITGYLMDVYISSYCAIGHVYKSVGYQNGALMLSEEISKVVEYDRRYLIETVDGERLLLVNFHPCGGRKSLKFLLELFTSGAMSGSRYCVQ